jgi:outer membrane biosynthesis protein TonB
MTLISKDQEIIFLYRYLLIVNTLYIFNKEKIKMEYIIGSAVIVILGYLAFRMNKSSVDSSSVELVTPASAPVVETAPVAVETPAPVVVEAPAPVVEAAPVAVEAPAKKPRKPRAPKVEQAPVKAVKAKAPVAKTTKAAVAKAPVKAVAKAPAKKPAARTAAKSKKA